MDSRWLELPAHQADETRKELPMAALLYLLIIVSLLALLFIIAIYLADGEKTHRSRTWSDIWASPNNRAYDERERIIEGISARQRQHRRKPGKHR
jgi:hypothetical protein